MGSRAGAFLLVFCLIGCSSNDDREDYPRGWKDGIPVSLFWENLERFPNPDHPLSATATVAEGVVEIRVENASFNGQNEFASLLRTVDPHWHEILIYPVKPPLSNKETPGETTYLFTISFSTASFSLDKGQHRIDLFAMYRANQTADKLTSVQVYVPG